MDADHESAGSENTEAAAPENAGGGVAEPENAAAQKSQWVAKGIEIARSRLLKEFGVENFDDLRGRLAQPEQDTDEEQQSAPQGDATDSKEYRSLAKKFRVLNNQHAEMERQIESLKAQADQARVEKLKACALSRGVGAGQQVEAFVRLFGDRVRFDSQQELEVLSMMPGSGELVAAGQTIDEFLDEVLPEVKFLLAPTEAPRGAGSRKGPVQDPAQRRGFGALDQIVPRKK